MEHTQNLVISKPDTDTTVVVAPARIIVEGKTMTDKRLSVVQHASFAACAYLSGGRGKVAKIAKEGIAANGVAMIAKAVRTGNYKPLAEALAATLGESVFISSRGTFEAYPEVLSAKLQDLKNGGYINKKDGTQAPSSKRLSLLAARDLCTNVADLASKIAA